MAETQVPFFQNDLVPIGTEDAALQSALQLLKESILQGLEMIDTHIMQLLKEDQHDYGKIFNGDLGIFYTAIRLEKQLLCLDTASDFQFFSSCIHSVKTTPANIIQSPLNPVLVQLSPFGSPTLSLTMIRLLSQKLEEQEEEYSSLHNAIQMALEQGETFERNGRAMGVDEILHGRVGLLWSLIRIYGETNVSNKISNLLKESIPKITNVILEAGKVGAKKFIEHNGQNNSMPLMWSWIDHYYSLGAIHGITGIFSILLDPELLVLYPNIESSYADIAESITSLCNICVSNDGHLPMSIPSWASSRTYPLLQICHGTPGLLLLIASAGKNKTFISKFGKVDWLEAVALGSERIWEQGLLSKGGGLCHGIGGNALVLLMLHDMFEYNPKVFTETQINTLSVQAKSIFEPQKLSGDYFLSRALAMLLECRNTRPFVDSNQNSQRQYRLPDNPFSLFEGLAGNVCAWAESFIVIQARVMHDRLKAEGIHNILSDARFQEIYKREFGFPVLSDSGL